ncbi:hypothetical protein LAZ67_20001557, partial [Cordylochernes scorpioides]
MLTVFFDYQGIVHHEFQQGSTITAESYLGVLRTIVKTKDRIVEYKISYYSEEVENDKIISNIIMSKENILKLQKYSGNQKDIRAQSWVKLFELHVADEDKGKLFFYYLEGRALEWYADEIAGTNIKQWETFKQKFITRFGSTTATPLIDAQRRYLRRDESVNDYFQSKFRLLKQTSLSKVEQIQMLTEGLPAQWKISLAPIHFEDIETWVSATLKLEAAFGSIQKNSKLAFNDNKFKDHTSYVASPPKPPYPCRFCKMRNLNNFHWHNECPYRPKTFPKESAANEQPSNLYATSDPSSSNSTDLPTVNLFKLIERPIFKFININTLVNSTAIQAFIDTGSTISIMSYSQFKNLNLQMEPSSSIYINQANSRTRSFGRVKVNLTISHITHQIDFHILRNFMYPLLLGLDVGTLFNLHVDIKNGVVTTKGPSLYNCKFQANHLRLETGSYQEKKKYQPASEEFSNLENVEATSLFNEDSLPSTSNSTHVDALSRNLVCIFITEDEDCSTTGRLTI